MTLADRLAVLEAARQTPEALARAARFQRDQEALGAALGAAFAGAVRDEYSPDAVWDGNTVSWTTRV